MAYSIASYVPSLQLFAEWFCSACVGNVYTNKLVAFILNLILCWVVGEKQTSSQLLQKGKDHKESEMNK